MSFGDTFLHCFDCHTEQIEDQPRRSQILVDHISRELQLEYDLNRITAPSISPMAQSNSGTNEAPSLAACDSSSSILTRQDSTASSEDSVELKDFISKNQDKEEPNPKIQPHERSLARLISSCSLASTESLHCPICLDPMTPIDHRHPLQCPTRHCHFNFCASCVNSLLSSSKDDYELASDGSCQVKIYLHCPNCRADLSTTIRDVLLLRKVDTVNWLLAQRGGKGVELNASQKRTRQAMEELHVQEAIQLARDKEIVFWKTHHRDLSGDEDEDVGEHKEDSGARHSFSRFESSWRPSDGSFTQEEWGVEADLDNGVHSSFHVPSNQLVGVSSHDETRIKKDHKPTTVDETLLQGLEGLMLHAEQLNVTHWMTSGEPDELARAAQVLRQVEDDARQGIKPADRQIVLNRRASVFEIVAETRELETKPAKPQSAPSILGNYYSRPMTHHQRQAILMQQRATEHRKLEMALAARASILDRCPLPVRMPKAVTLELRNDPEDRGFPLRFCNDNWDGTVLDAYTKLNVAAASRRHLASGASPEQQPWTVTKKPQGQHPGVFNVLSQGEYQRHCGLQVQLTTDQPPRVLIASVQGAAGRQGVMKGDVVTHIDGLSLAGKTVDDLVTILRAKREAGHASTQMVLNAEASIAEALKRRSIVLDD